MDVLLSIAMFIVVMMAVAGVLAVIAGIVVGLVGRRRAARYTDDLAAAQRRAKHVLDNEGNCACATFSCSPADPDFADRALAHFLETNR